MRLLYFIFILYSINIFGQTDKQNSQIQVTYRLKQVGDTLANGAVAEEDLFLLLNGQKSLFRSSVKYAEDSITEVVRVKSFSNIVDGKVIIDVSSIPTPIFRSEVFSDNGNQIIYKELLKTKFSFPLENKIVWELKNETKKISSYQCKKAVGKYKGRTYIAWYTDTIPIPDGPYVFKGLPGLILEVYDKSDFINFTMVGFKNIQKPMILMKNVAATTYQAFFNARQTFLNDPSGILSTVTGIKTPQKYVENVNTNARAFNNYID
ncbi:GLPGLI family protein [Frigoriflavimonas asaccharolytica]|uniref:GLPGLI family protein n=1 Tax=Frigoriflavimonas asaccharolytica TaxID=2735899 RepID=A0A8J8G8N0_9FLAO|nr:GLPGLI family protein [Frigoriflavimonas asaccharolytica]NRS93463.1 GLPGLI family protein [Frigoriflavimonas asaccharolytica]